MREVTRDSPRRIDSFECDPSDSSFCDPGQPGGLCRLGGPIAMTLLYYDPIYLNHDTGHHPECAERLVSITARLAADGLASTMPAPDVGTGRSGRSGPGSSFGLCRQCRAVCRARRWVHRTRHGGQPGLVSGGHFGCGAAVDATRRVVRGEDSQALCLVRPPGHHAVQLSAMGFCLFNNIAIAARTATAELEIDRVLIVDWDVHHGNGTQAAFWEDEQVGVFSIHRAPFYPGTGDEDETGAGKGLGTTRNLAIRFGTPRREYMSRFAHELTSFADKIRPQLVLISAGFDTHVQDPVGSLGLEDEDFVSLTNIVLDVADHLPGDAWSACWKVATTCAYCRDRSQRIWKRCLPVRQANVRTTRPNERAGRCRDGAAVQLTWWRSE